MNRIQLEESEPEDKVDSKVDSRVAEKTDPEQKRQSEHDKTKADKYGTESDENNLPAPDAISQPPQSVPRLSLGSTGSFQGIIERPFSTGSRRMRDMSISSMRNQPNIYKDFLQAPSSREWLKRNQSSRLSSGRDGYAPNDGFVKRDLEEMARKINTIERKLLFSSRDSKERARTTRTVFEGHGKNLEHQRLIRTMARDLLQQKEKEFRQQMTDEYLPQLDKEIVKLKSVSDAFSSRTQEALYRNWKKSLDRRIHIEIEKKKITEWSMENLMLESERRLQEEREKERRKSREVESKPYSAIFRQQIQERFEYSSASSTPSRASPSLLFTPIAQIPNASGTFSRSNSTSFRSTSNLLQNTYAPVPPAEPNPPERSSQSRPSSSNGPRSRRIVDSVRETSKESAQKDGSAASKTDSARGLARDVAHDFQSTSKEQIYDL